MPTIQETEPTYFHFTTKDSKGNDLFVEVELLEGNITDIEVTNIVGDSVDSDIITQEEVTRNLEMKGVILNNCRYLEGL